MKKIILILALFACAGTASAQFPTQDSLVKYINKWIRNSAVDAFTNLRMNTALIGMTKFIDSAGILSFTKPNDSTIRLVTRGRDTFNLVIGVPGGGGSGTVNSGTQYQLAYYNATGTAVIGLTLISANRALISDANGLPVASATTATEIAYMNGVTSSVQDQLNSKQASGNYITATTGDVVATGPGSVSATIQANAVTDAKLRQSAGLSIIGRATNSTGNVADITAGTDGQTLRRNGTALDFGSLDLAKAAAITNQLPNANLVTFKNYPAEQQLGIIYEANSWTDLSAFATQGTASIALSGGYVNITSNTQLYTPLVTILPGRATGLTKWKMTVRYAVTAWSSTSNWFGLMLKSKVDHSGAQFGYQAFTGVTNSGAGLSFIAEEGGPLLESGGAGPVKSLNDIMEATFERNDTVLTYTVKNVTTGSATQTLVYTFPQNHSVILPNVGNWALMYNNQGGTIQLRYLKIESAETYAPNVLCIGDSKTAIGYADNYAGRWWHLLKPVYPSVIGSAGSAEYITDALFKKEELLQLRPEKVVLGFIGENDIRDGVPIATVVANAEYLYNAYTNGGTEVYWLGFPEDSTAGGASLTAYWNWIKARWPNNYIDTWDALSTGNKLDAIYNSGDGVHYNQAGMNIIYSTIVSSGKLSVISPNRRTLTRKTDGNVQQTGDSLHLAWSVLRVANNLPKFDSKYNMVGSSIYDNGVNTIVSNTIQPTAPLSNLLTFNVNGEIGTYGPESGLYNFGRDDITKYGAIYNNGNITRWNINGTDRHYYNSEGRMHIGNYAGNPPFSSLLLLKQDRTFSSAQGKRGFFFVVDSATVTFSGATSLFGGAINSFLSPLMQSSGGATSFTRLPNVYIEAPRLGTDMTATSLPALELAGDLYQENSGAKYSLVNSSALSSTAGGQFNGFNKLLPTAADQQLAFFGGGTMNNSTTETVTGGWGVYSTAAFTFGSSHQTHLRAYVETTTSLAEVMRITANQRVGIRTTNPQGALHLPANQSSTGGAAAMYTISGASLLSTIAAGAWEPDANGRLFYSIASSAGSRRQMVYTDSAGAVPNGRIPIGNGTDYTSATITAGTGVSVTNGSGSITLSVNSGYITSGSYSPSTTLVTNADGATVQSGHYTRIGNVITGSLSIDIDPTAAGSVEIGLSPVVASTFSSVHICSGTANGDGIAGQVTSDNVNSRIRIVFTATDGTSKNFRLNFQYIETLP